MRELVNLWPAYNAVPMAQLRSMADPAGPARVQTSAMYLFTKTRCAV